MRDARGLVARYAALSLDELREATREFDREMVIDDSRPLNATESQAWARAKRKPGRPRRGAGVKVVSVSVERGLLSRADSLAQSLGISRASLIERGLKALLSASGRG